MNIVERGHAFVQSLRQLASRSVWEWRRCPHCGDTLTRKNGSYKRRPWLFEGRREVRVQRHWCHPCQRTYSERSPLLVRGSWYGREVHRYAIDQWQHMGASLRRTAEEIRSWLGRQERWLVWFSRDEAERERCLLSASTVHRWLDRAGEEAERSLKGQLDGIAISGQLGVDGLWARLRGGTKRVVLAIVDSISGLILPPVVEKEESTAAWEHLFERARLAGLELAELRGVTSDGVKGLVGYLDRALGWVNHQRCVFHLWRPIIAQIAAQVDKAAVGMLGAAAEAVREQARQELVSLVKGVLDAHSEWEAQAALARLAAHRLGRELARFIAEHLDQALVHLLEYNRGLMRVAPEWVWRDFRSRLSHGRNHCTDQRLERAALAWAIYRNFTPAQWRSERKRHYRRPGRSPLDVAGASPGKISYLDALSV